MSAVKVSQNAEAMLKTYDRFSYEIKCYIINWSCKHELAIAAP